MKDAPARLLAEFLGVFFLCLFGIGAIMNGADLTGVALAHGLAIFIAICAFAHISGAHFNPAVTVALAATKRTTVYASPNTKPGCASDVTPVCSSLPRRAIA